MIGRGRKEPGPKRKNTSSGSHIPCWGKGERVEDTKGPRCLGVVVEGDCGGQAE
jgi:hypothetical protein